MIGTAAKRRGFDSSKACSLQGGRHGSPSGLQLVLPLLLPLAVLISPLTAPAAVPCDEPLVQVAYEADTLPEDDPVAPWIANVTGDVLAFVESGILTIVAQANGSVVYDRGEERMANSDAYAFSARVWLEQTQPDASRAGILIGGKDGIKSPRIILFDWPDYGRRFVRLETLSWPAPEVELDWSEPHAYRLEVVRAGLARVYVDGNLIIEHPYADLTDCTPGEESFGLSQFGMAESIVHWDWVRYEFCASPAGPENQTPVAEAGEAQEVYEGDWVTLDATGSADPEGQEIGLLWTQTEGPRVKLDEPSSATPGFFAPEAPDGTPLGFKLLVMDPEGATGADEVLVLVRSRLPDQGVSSLLSAVSTAPIPQGQRRRLARLLEEAMEATTCLAKEEALRGFLEEVGRAGRWLPTDLADAWAAAGQELLAEVGPCAKSCREEGGIEGTNLALTSLGARPVPGPTGSTACAGCTGAGLALDGDEGTAWVAPGEGSELVVDLGARQVIKGARVVGPFPQAYRLEIWNDLTSAWEQVAHRTQAVKVGLEDFCDTQTRFVRFVNEGTEGSGDTVVSELEVYGTALRQPRTVWPGNDPSLTHEVGRAEETAWVAGADEVGWLSAGPHTLVSAGRRWVQFHVQTDGQRSDGEPVGRVLVIRERGGQQFVEAEGLVWGRPAENPKTLEFKASADSRYSFAVYDHGGVGLILEKIVLKDHPGGFSYQPLTYLVGPSGRRVEVLEREHILRDLVVQLPGSSGQTLLHVEPARPSVPNGPASTMGPGVHLTTDTPLSDTRHLRVRMPIDIQALQLAGANGRDLLLEVSGDDGRIQTLGGNLGRWWRIPTVPMEPLDIELRPALELDMPTFGFADPGGPAPVPSGFAADHEAYNLLHYTLNDHFGSPVAVDSSLNGNAGRLIGDAQFIAGGVYGGAIAFRAGRLEADIGLIPKAFSIEMWLRIDTLGAGERTIVAAQTVNFRLVAERSLAAGGAVNILHLEVYDANRSDYLRVATTTDDTSPGSGWHHVVALYDGHFKGRIYVDGRVNRNGINVFDSSLGHQITAADIQTGPGWPRAPGTTIRPFVLGRPAGMIEYRTFTGAMDEVRFSDLTRFRTANAPSCPPRCRPGEHGNQDPNAMGNRYHLEGNDWYTPVQGMHDQNFPFRFPYIQDVTDHSALVVWRSQCEPKYIHLPNGADIVFLPTMTFCLGEAGKPMDKCSAVLPSAGVSDKDKYPDCQYAIRLSDLRPSTWYHYKVREDTVVYGDLPHFWDFELATDAHFRTAPLASDDPLEFVAFGDFAPQVENDILGIAKCFIERSFDSSICCSEECVIKREPYEDSMVASELAQMTMPDFGEAPDFWLAPGDLAQTTYNADNFEAYVFGEFNRVKGYPQGGAILSNGFMMGVPLYAALGNHNWSGCYHSEFSFWTLMLFILSGGIHGTEEPPDWFKGKWVVEGGDASVQMNNLFPPYRHLESQLYRRFKYGASSYSFDYGNMHIVSLGGAHEAHFLKAPATDMTTVHDPEVDKAAHIGEWNYQIDSSWVERLGLSGKEKDAEQMVWLKRDLFPYSKDDEIWKVVFLHAPLVRSYWMEEDQQDPVRARLLLFLQEACVDLILSGHKHEYRREPTGPTIQERLNVQTDEDQWAAHFILGTGGYCHYQDPKCPAETWGAPRFFVDGNALFVFYHDIAPASGCDSCLLLKGVEGIPKSECRPLSEFPEHECASHQEGEACLSQGTGLGDLQGRCMRPRLSWWGVVDCPSDMEGNAFVPWLDLRCIPLATHQD